MASYFFFFFTIKIQRHSTKRSVARALPTFNLITKHSPLAVYKQSSMSPIVLTSVSFPGWLHASLPGPGMPLLRSLIWLSCHIVQIQPNLAFQEYQWEVASLQQLLALLHFWLLTFRASIMAWHERVCGFLGTAHLCCWKASTREWWYQLSYFLIHCWTCCVQKYPVCISQGLVQLISRQLIVEEHHWNGGG